jgi:pyridoxal phosphate enzyme (YggS family)
LSVLDNVSLIYKRMSHAAMRAGRNPEEVMLVAVTKTVDATRIREAVDAGVRVFGESKVQEAARKIEELREAEGLAGLNIIWHMVGHLQKNKAGAAVEVFDLIHSLDSVELAELLDRHAARRGKLQRALIQVKLSEEESKYGVGEEEVASLLRATEAMENLKVEGLMTIPPFFDDPERARPFYRRLKALAGEHGLRELSMGMTNDFETAIEEGATMVRIGTAIFGERDYSHGGRS